ncbi:MAG TPA: hypothetical protein VHY56_12035 [Candidatus Binataceae bacterium]|nr:hypothetical protein [Candidatus Binataceae bacterium]
MNLKTLAVATLGATLFVTPVMAQMATAPPQQYGHEDYDHHDADMHRAHHDADWNHHQADADRDGDYDEHHQWHKRDWWVKNHPKWVHKHHPHWFS